MAKSLNEEVNRSLTLLAKGSIIIFIGVFLSKLLTYVYKIIIARSFGPEAYGLFSLSIIIVSLFSTIASLGFSEGLLRYVSLHNNQKNIKKLKPLLNFSLILAVISGTILSLVLFLFSNLIAIKIFHNPSLGIYLKYFSLGIPFVLISNLFLSIIKANMNILRHTFILNILQNTIRLLGLSLLIFFSLKSYAIIGSYLMGVFSVAIGSYFGAKIYINKIFSQKELSYSNKKKITKEFISYSWPFVFAGFVGTVLYWIDSLVIGNLIDTTSVGIYGVAFTIVSILSIAPELFMQIFLPVIIKEYSSDNIEVIKQTSKQVSKWIGILNIPIFTLIFIFPERIIEILFGNQYLEATLSLKILAFSGFISSFSGINTSLISMKGKSKAILKTLFIASISNLFLNIFLVSLYGIIGAAIATTLTWFLALTIFSVQAYKLTGIFPFRRKLFKLFLVSVIPFIFITFLKDYFGNTLAGLISAAMIYSLIYISLILITNIFDQNDILMLKKFLNFVKLKKITSNLS